MAADRLVVVGLPSRPSWAKQLFDRRAATGGAELLIVRALDTPARSLEQFRSLYQGQPELPAKAPRGTLRP